MSKKVYYMDCGVFYDNSTGEVIVDYSNMVANDYDVAGSVKANELFRELHPDYEMAQS